MPRFSERKKRELRAEELRVILDPAGHEGYKAELARLEQWLALDAELAADAALARKRGRPKGRRRNAGVPGAPKRKRGRPKGSKSMPAAPAAPERKRGRPKKVAS